MKNILEISLGGADYKLQFSMGLARILDEEFDIDLIDVSPNFSEKVSSGSKLIKFVQGVIWSGITNHANINKQSHPLKKDDLLTHLDALMPKESTELAVTVIKWIFDCMGVPAELSNDASSEEAGEEERFHVGEA